jgi:tetratricopeptide (TPR) repeat protein
MVSNQAPMRLRAIICVGLLAGSPVGLALGCAPKGPSPALVADAAKAKALVQQGCYSCLNEALSIYDRLSSAKAPVAGTAEGRFDAALLIAIREKELGIPGDESMIRARTLVLPSRQAVLDAAELIIGDTTSLDPDQRALATGRNRPALDADNPKRRALDAAPADDVVARYVSLSIDCEQQKLSESVDAKVLTAAYAGVPLLQFRLSVCGRPGGPPVAALRANDPRWADTLFWEGRRELTSSLGRAIDFPKVLSLYAQGREAFPKSLMLMIAWANTNLIAEDFEAALSGFDDVLAVYATHRDAMNGRMQAQSYLMRHPEAIATATRLLELGTWHIADANYWRAWNRYHLKEYDAAWDDVENATRGLSNSRVYMLAGLIAYARKDLPIAVERFDRAYELNASACDAAWMSGLVSIDQNQLAIAAPKFTRGMSCFITTAKELREDRARTEADIQKRGTPATAREQRNLDRLQRDADTADEKASQSAYNGAQCYARTGQKRDALTLIDAAIAHPLMREKAIAMKAAIEKLPN